MTGEPQLLILLHTPLIGPSLITEALVTALNAVQLVLLWKILDGVREAARLVVVKDEKDVD